MNKSLGALSLLVLANVLPAQGAQENEDRLRNVSANNLFPSSAVSNKLPYDEPKEDVREFLRKNSMDSLVLSPTIIPQDDQRIDKPYKYLRLPGNWYSYTDDAKEDYLKDKFVDHVRFNAKKVLEKEFADLIDWARRFEYQNLTIKAGPDVSQKTDVEKLYLKKDKFDYLGLRNEYNKYLSQTKIAVDDWEPCLKTQINHPKVYSELEIFIRRAVLSIEPTKEWAGFTPRAEITFEYNGTYSIETSLSRKRIRFYLNAGSEETSVGFRYHALDF